MKKFQFFIFIIFFTLLATTNVASASQNEKQATFVLDLSYDTHLYYYYGGIKDPKKESANLLLNSISNNTNYSLFHLYANQPIVVDNTENFTEMQNALNTRRVYASNTEKVYHKCMSSGSLCNYNYSVIPFSIGYPIKRTLEHSVETNEGNQFKEQHIVFFVNNDYELITDPYSVFFAPKDVVEEYMYRFPSHKELKELANSNNIIVHSIIEKDSDIKNKELRQLSIDTNGSYCVMSNTTTKEDCVNHILDNIKNTPKSKISGINAAENVKQIDESNINTSSLFSDPIDTSTGAMLTSKSLLSYQGIEPFNFSIHNNSLITEENLLGNGWYHDYYSKVEKIDDSNFKIYWNKNDYTIFTKDSSNLFKPSHKDKRFKELILNTDGSFLLKSKNNEDYIYDSVGLLIEKKNNLRTIKFHYNSENQLNEVKQIINNKENNLVFYYNLNGLLEKVTDSNSREVKFNYNDKNNLIEVIDANGNSIRYNYDSNNRIIEAIDNEEIVYLKNEYDSFGRVIKQFDSNNNFSTLSYSEDVLYGYLITTVTNREGKTKKLIHDTNYNLIEVSNELGNSTKFTYDTRGNQLSETNANGDTTLMTYDESNNIASITDALGRKILMEYDERDNLVKVTTPKNQVIFNEYNEKNELTKITDLKGNVTTFAYVNGLLTEKVEPDNQITTYEYTNGSLSKTTDPEGNITSYRTDSLGRIIEQTDPNGNVTKFKYDNNNNQIEIMNPLEKIFQKTYDSHNELVSITDYKGILEEFKYDANGNLISSKREEQNNSFEYNKEGLLIKSTSPKGYISSVKYDALGRVIEETNEEGIKTTYQYDNVGNLSSKTIGESTTSYEYDKVGNLISEKDAKGNTTSYKYNELNQRIEEINAKGNKTNFAYDSFGNLTSETDSLQHTISYEYDKNNNLTQIKDAKGNITTFEYDKNNRLVKKTNALGQTNHYTYDKNGNLIQSFDALGNATTKEYDSLNRLIKITDALDHSRSTEYDELGNITAIYDAKGNKISSIQYDQYNNPTSVTDALGNKVTNEYDSENNLIQIIDELNRVNKRNYDKLGQTTATVDANEIESNSTYNEFGQTTSYSDPNANQTTYLYDKLGQVLKETNATTNSKNYEYDELGNLTKSINGRGQEATYTYDAVGNVVKKVDPDGTIEYSYDENYNLLTVKETNGDKIKTISREYDTLNRMVKYTDEFGNVIQYEYNEVGNISRITYPDNKVVKYTYDKVGNMKTVTDWNNQVTTYSYDENNQLILTVKPNGSKEIREYDFKGQLTKLVNSKSNGEIINSYTYEYDAVGNVIKENDNTYGYDNLNRITSTNGRKYSYDNAGNLLSAEKTEEEPVNQQFTYGADNQISTYNTSVTTYDKDGNLLDISLNGETLSGFYDSRNHLTSIGGTKYFYNAENKRTSIEENGEITRFVVSPHTSLDQVLMETDNSGNPIAYYVYGVSLISKETSSGDKFYYHYDRRGSTVALTNQSEEITDAYKYDIYGEQLNKSGDTPNRFLYNGKYGVMTDSNGLYHMRARYYNPEIKRFINRDIVQGSILESQTFNRYAYVNGNPISYIDPFGLSREEDSSCSVLDYDCENNPKSTMGYWDYRMNKTGEKMLENLTTYYLTGNSPYADRLGPIKVGRIPAYAIIVGTGYDECPECQNTVNNLLNGPSSCFAAGTLIETSEGKKNIENIKIGDKVLSKNDKTGKQEYKKVVQLFEREVNETYILKIGNQSITTTEDHPFWVKDKGWVLAKNLKKGDYLETSDGNNVIIDDIIINNGKVKVYNFEVEDYHTYFVSELGIWVHNDCRPKTVEAAIGYETKLANRTTVLGEYSDEYYKKYPSKILREEMKNAGITTPPYGNAAHHIVPVNDSRAEEARFYLDEMGIEYNAGVNGVFLPYEDDTYVGYETIHKGNHGPKYINMVTEKLRTVYNEYGGNTQEGVKVLNGIRRGLLNGSIKLN